MDLTLLHDFILVKEITDNGTIEGTNLNLKYDDSSHFMLAEIVEISQELHLEYIKQYPALQEEGSYNVKRFVNSLYKPGTRIVLQRIAKVPYKDGLYFASYKDVLAIVGKKELPEEPKYQQMKLFERDEF